MEAPEKIFIQSFNVSEEDAKFDKSKLFFDDVWTEEPETGVENIEYTRTDAFILKASEWLSKHAKKYYFNKDGHYLGTDELIEDFKLSMELWHT